MTTGAPGPHGAAVGAAVGTARRGWFRLVAAGAAVAALGTAAWQFRRARQPPQTVAELERAMIERIVDLLVPRDETPGAIDLGVHDRVLEGMARSTPLALACGEMMREADRDARVRHGADFLALDAARQTDVLQALAQGPSAGAGRRGFALLRREVMRLYYSQPPAWPSLGLDGPPQPIGFPDYTDPPQRRA